VSEDTADSGGAALADESAPPETPEQGLLDHTVGWLSATREKARSVTHLAMAEAKLAAFSIALMAFLGVLAAISVFGAWGLVIAGIVYGLMQAGLPLWVALFGMAILQAVIAWVLWRSAIRLSRHLEFRATRAQILKTEEPTA
jgi:hypothetical protein